MCVVVIDLRYIAFGQCNGTIKSCSGLLTSSRRKASIIAIDFWNIACGQSNGTIRSCNGLLTGSRKGVCHSNRFPVVGLMVLSDLAVGC